MVFELINIALASLIIPTGMAVDETTTATPISISVDENIENGSISYKVYDISESTEDNAVLVTDPVNYAENDLCVFTISPSSFYLVNADSITIGVEGETAVAVEGETNTYSFSLKANTSYVLSANFDIDITLFQKFIKIYNQAKAGDWSSIFSAENALSLINLVLNSGIGIALVKVLTTYKKFKSMSTGELTEYFEKRTPELASSMTTALKTLEAKVDKLISDNDELTKANKVYAQCLTLAQENTPEAKLAIVKNLTGLTSNDSTLTDIVTKTIQDYVAQQKADSAATTASIEEMKKANDAVINNKPITTDTTDTTTNRPLD